MSPSLFCVFKGKDGVPFCWHRFVSSGASFVSLSHGSEGISNVFRVTRLYLEGSKTEQSDKELVIKTKNYPISRTECTFEFQN